MNTDKKICRDLVSLLHAYGVRRVVLCPGTRNAPLIMAVNRHESMRHTVVVDERSAGFVALGMAVQSGEPVAVVCTSGTAVLNLGPALAEAYYREVPVIAVTADRPAHQIDIDEGQTLRQPGVFANYVKAGVQVGETNGHDLHCAYVRLINDVLHEAVSGKKGPVHINVAINEPVGGETEVDAQTDKPGKIEVMTPPRLFATGDVRRFAFENVKDRKVLLLFSMMAPNTRINRAVQRINDCQNIVVMHEAQSNLHVRDAIGNIDGVLSAMTAEERERMLPDVVITIGANPLSRMVKDWLKNSVKTEHWHIGVRDCAADTFGCMTRRIEAPVADFLPQLASAMRPYTHSSVTYKKYFNVFVDRSIALDKAFAIQAPFSDFMAMQTLIAKMPDKYNLHVSNGTTVRYLQQTDYAHLHRIDVNRGVSGIDGCTSTAIGAALAYGGPTALISGDMSAQYDMGSLAQPDIPSSFRMIVLDNIGGNIFRCINNTRHLAEVDECMAADVRLPLADLARGYGFEYYEAMSADELNEVLKHYFEDSFRPAILRVVSDPRVSAKVFTEYYKRKHIL